MDTFLVRLSPLNYTVYKTLRQRGTQNSPVLEAPTEALRSWTGTTVLAANNRVLYMLYGMTKLYICSSSAPHLFVCQLFALQLHRETGKFLKSQVAKHIYLFPADYELLFPAWVWVLGGLRTLSHLHSLFRPSVSTWGPTFYTFLILNSPPRVWVLDGLKAHSHARKVRPFITDIPVVSKDLLRYSQSLLLPNPPPLHH